VVPAGRGALAGQLWDEELEAAEGPAVGVRVLDPRGGLPGPSGVVPARALPGAACVPARPSGSLSPVRRRRLVVAVAVAVSAVFVEVWAAAVVLLAVRVALAVLGRVEVSTPVHRAAGRARPLATAAAAVRGRWSAVRLVAILEEEGGRPGGGQRRSR